MENKKVTSIEWFVDQLPTRIINKYLIEIEIAKGKKIIFQAIFAIKRVSAFERIYSNEFKIEVKMI